MQGRLVAVGLVALGAWAASCAVHDGHPNDGVAIASSSERAFARAQRQARAKAKTEQIAPDEPTPAAALPEPVAPPPEPSPPPPEPEPIAEVEDGAGGAGGAAPAPPPTATASAAPPEKLTPEKLCTKLCDRVVECLGSILGPPPPGVGGDMFERLREECTDECNAEVAEKMDDAKACLEIEDCKAFVDCVKSLDD